jgi:hypothetical protein
MNSVFVPLGWVGLDFRRDVGFDPVYGVIFTTTR